MKYSELCEESSFAPRHFGPSESDIKAMLETLGFHSLDEMTGKIIPKEIQLDKSINLPAPLTEREAIEELRQIMAKNEKVKSHIGMGYYPTITPPVIQRNILENPAWYTAYTPYQPEISQGRLEALFNFQTLFTELTGLEIANASLLDEGTAAAEAVALAHRVNKKNKSNHFVVSDKCHPQTIDIIETRAHRLGLTIELADPFTADLSKAAGVVLSYPDTDGVLRCHKEVVDKIHSVEGKVIVVVDPLALTLFKEPGSWDADIVVGSAQRFGVPMGFGGPHAAFLATRLEYQRQIPGRIVGESRDVDGNRALRLALQTREQHIRRQKATSNICTSQVLLANIASMYAVYHGPKGLKRIAQRIHLFATMLRNGLQKLGFETLSGDIFDTVKVYASGRIADITSRAVAAKRNFRKFGEEALGIALDETTTKGDLLEILDIFADKKGAFTFEQLLELLPGEEGDLVENKEVLRETSFLSQEVFHSHHSETEMLRYMMSLQLKDYSLANGMIPLGSCTMKLNATTEMLALSWDEVMGIHPFAPKEQVAGYQELLTRLEAVLAEITGLDATSLQPNSGAQGEYAGMLTIRRYLDSIGESERDICIIPESAHGTNPASAAMAGMKIAVVKCAENGDLDLDALRETLEKHKGKIAAAMVTYPSTHGVFESSIRELCKLLHDAGGQVYLDGANMNAQAGLCRPGDYGADVVHLNLHKTFAIPHGGGGPGVGPICVRKHLVDFLPGHTVSDVAGRHKYAVSSAPYGSASIFTISWLYIRMLGADGLRKASQLAILNANYISKVLADYLPTLYTSNGGFVAHECILDPRAYKKVSVGDIAKRLMDYGFHAPTVSFPVAGTLMVEPTESESKAELDRFCDAIKQICEEMKKVENGEYPADNNPLSNAPHTAYMLTQEPWEYPYSRQVAAYPFSTSQSEKYWPAVRRIDEVGGDRNLVCSCPPVADYAIDQ